jgi:hypothetical protein
MCGEAHPLLGQFGASFIDNPATRRIGANAMHTASARCSVEIGDHLGVPVNTRQAAPSPVSPDRARAQRHYWRDRTAAFVGRRFLPTKTPAMPPVPPFVPLRCLVITEM